MGGSPPSLSLAHDLLRELRQGTRRIEVVNSSGRRINDDSWTKDAIEVRTNTLGDFLPPAGDDASSHRENCNRFSVHLQRDVLILSISALPILRTSLDHFMCGDLQQLEHPDGCLLSRCAGVREVRGGTTQRRYRRWVGVSCNGEKRKRDNDSGAELFSLPISP